MSGDATTANATVPAPLEPARLPAWATELITLYESGAASQFVLYGNIEDRVVLPLVDKPRLGNLTEFLREILLPKFDVVLSYDIGNGIRIESGGPLFAQWPSARDGSGLPKQPRAAIEHLTHYFRYLANFARLGQKRLQVGVILKGAQTFMPPLGGGYNYNLSALSSLVRDWTVETLLVEHPIATFLLTENLNDLHPLAATNPRAARVNVPLPAPAELEHAFQLLAPAYPLALEELRTDLTRPARQLAGATLGAIESLLKTKEHRREQLRESDLLRMKKRLVEDDCAGLIEFIESDNDLDDLYGLDRIKTWFRQDIELWRQGDLEAMPMGYLLCGPVGTGKTYLVRCLAGEAAVPVVKLKNFRDKWVGSTEGNLEKIFRLLHALGRCFVFVDEADQALGGRSSGSNDSGLSGRIYSMIAEEMSNTNNRGKIIWVLASSRPDLIEVDLKRPGRVDVKIPIFPTTEPEESFALIRALCKRRDIIIDKELLTELRPRLPLLLTPGAAEAIAVKLYRQVKTRKQDPATALRELLKDYQNPVPAGVMASQIRLAMAEATDLEFVPAAIRDQFGYPATV